MMEVAGAEKQGLHVDGLFPRLEAHLNIPTQAAYFKQAITAVILVQIREKDVPAVANQGSLARFIFAVLSSCAAAFDCHFIVGSHGNKATFLADKADFYNEIETVVFSAV